jgi:molybdenum cofactor sulfurtransferase
MPPTRMALGKLSESHSTFLDSDFPNLSLSNPNRTVYLDTTGAALYSKSQLEAVFADLAQNLYSNPHSCPRTRDKIVAARRRTLRHFLASEDDYAVIFTSGTTASLKLVAESFCWSADSTFAYANESHTSVVGMREIVEAKIETFDNDVPRLGAGTNLVAFPAMSNFCGRKFSLDLIDAIKKAGSGNYVLLDAASHASNAPLDLSRYRPDFVCVSFYKMFGYPTGLGALLVRHEALGMLKAGLPHVREVIFQFGRSLLNLS